VVVVMVVVVVVVKGSSKTTEIRCLVDSTCDEAKIITGSPMQTETKSLNNRRSRSHCSWPATH